MPAYASKENNFFNSQIFAMVSMQAIFIPMCDL